MNPSRIELDMSDISEPIITQGRGLTPEVSIMDDAPYQTSPHGQNTPASMLDEQAFKKKFKQANAAQVHQDKNRMLRQKQFQLAAAANAEYSWKTLADLAMTSIAAAEIAKEGFVAKMNYIDSLVKARTLKAKKDDFIAFMKGVTANGNAMKTVLDKLLVVHKVTENRHKRGANVASNNKSKKGINLEVMSNYMDKAFAIQVHTSELQEIDGELQKLFGNAATNWGLEYPVTKDQVPQDDVSAVVAEQASPEEVKEIV